MRPRDQRKMWPIALSISDAASCLQIPRSKLYAAIKERSLPYHQHGVHRRLLVSEIEAWVQRYWKLVEL